MDFLGVLMVIVDDGSKSCVIILDMCYCKCNMGVLACEKQPKGHD